MINLGKNGNESFNINYMYYADSSTQNNLAIASGTNSPSFRAYVDSIRLNDVQEKRVINSSVSTGTLTISLDFDNYDYAEVEMRCYATANTSVTVTGSERNEQIYANGSSTYTTTQLGYVYYLIASSHSAFVSFKIRKPLIGTRRNFNFVSSYTLDGSGETSIIGRGFLNNTNNLVLTTGTGLLIGEYVVTYRKINST
jgi:hypothetical protein